MQHSIDPSKSSKGFRLFVVFCPECFRKYLLVYIYATSFFCPASWNTWPSSKHNDWKKKFLQWKMRKQVSSYDIVQLGSCFNRIDYHITIKHIKDIGNWNSTAFLLFNSHGWPHCAFRCISGCWLFHLIVSLRR